MNDTEEWIWVDASMRFKRATMPVQGMHCSVAKRAARVSR
jgi:hypothetical protein